MSRVGNKELDMIERRHRRADARFRGLPTPDDEGGEQLGTKELVLGGALIGLLLLALILLFDKETREKALPRPPSP